MEERLQEKKAEISIIIPVYNVEKYLARCLDSVLGQTFDDFEVILLNDGSTDSSGEICREYAAKDGRIKLFSQTNQGLSMARNNALQQAQGRYIYFLDSDDCIHPQLLQLLHQLAEKEQVDMVCFDYEECRDGEDPGKGRPLVLEQLDYKVFAGDEVLFHGLLKRPYVIYFNVCTKFYRRKLLEGISFIPKIRFEDVPFVYEVLSRHPKTAIMEAKLYYYTLSPGSLSRASGSVQHIYDYQTGIMHIYDIYKQKGREHELEFLKQEFIPEILRQQMGYCNEAQGSVKAAMFRALAAELADLRSKDLLLLRKRRNLSFLRKFGWRYLLYCWVKRG